MSRYRRSTAKGATFFFTVNTYQRRRVLTDEDVRLVLRQAIIETRSRLPFHIHAWVLLPDHLHCVWELPEGDADFGMRWSLIKRYVSQRCAHRLSEIAQSPSRQKRQESGLWQRRFWEHQIRDEEDFRRHVDYIHWNPVKHALVSRVGDWPWSTFHRYVADGIYRPDWCHQESDFLLGE